ncbi:hypothetical protein [Aureimonas sp. AU40]|uniref:hypothetical protein n=1 Tax=Aureimonas sp. AU40 TaxID=1637747 RepID=UPI0007822BED|nr:hypothetical protein [Aureimonas sp. AU40]
MSTKASSDHRQGLAARPVFAALRRLAALPRRWLHRAEPEGHDPEPPGVRSGLILAILAGWVVFLAASLTGLYWMAAEVVRPMPASQTVSDFPEPRLQIDARSDLETLSAAQSERLNRTGWVDRPTGRVEIPIGRAMDLVAGMGARAWQPLEAGAPDNARARAVNAAEQAQGRTP